VFAILEDERPYYEPYELGDFLEHQLSASVEFDLQSLEPGSQRLLAAARACGAGSGIRTFGDLFRSSHPPLQLLHLTKNFAKHHLHHPVSPIPREIATVLYYASIAAGLVRCDRYLSQLDPRDLARGLAQVLGQDWLDPQTRALLHDGLARVQSIVASGPGSLRR
jgi:hypothetical protein